MRTFLAAILATSVIVGANAAETYSIDPEHTHATFSFQHMGFSTFRGKIPARSGTIVLDRERKTGTVEVVFDMNGIATGVPKFDNHLRHREEFFEVEKHPTARFESTKISFNGDAPSTVVGTLTIKGITKPVTLQVTSFKCGQHPIEKAPACGANASATIKRSDFGLTYGLGNVRDEIGLEIGVEAIQK
jgi:polyisoprenoid-binding protein YceI